MLHRRSSYDVLEVLASMSGSSSEAFRELAEKARTKLEESRADSEHVMIIFLSILTLPVCIFGLLVLLTFVANEGYYAQFGAWSKKISQRGLERMRGWRIKVWQRGQSIEIGPDSESWSGKMRRWFGLKRREAGVGKGDQDGLPDYEMSCRGMVWGEPGWPEAGVHVTAVPGEGR